MRSIVCAVSRLRQGCLRCSRGPRCRGSLGIVPMDPGSCRVVIEVNKYVPDAVVVVKDITRLLISAGNAGIKTRAAGRAGDKCKFAECGARHFSLTQFCAASRGIYLSPR
ncbi:hypothetical protein ACJJTC_008608 [Scirpophaga incertulas]